MKLNFTSGLVLVLISIFVAPVAVLSYRALNSPPEPSTAPTTQIRMLASPLARIPYLPPTSNSISGKPNKPTPEPATIDWGDVANKPAGFADDLDNDALAELNCNTDQLARWNGSAWECISLAVLEQQIAALVALHPTPTPTPIPIPPRSLVFAQPVAISGAAGITGWRSSAVVDGQGTVHVVWISTPTPSSIMYTSKPAGGVWSQPFNVSGLTKGVLQQDLSVTPDGSVHVVWRQFEENIISQGFASIFYASLTPGEGWTSPVDIDQSQIDATERPLIAVDGTGRVHVVWEDNYISNNGTGWSAPVEIGGNFRDTRRLVAEPDGTLHLLSVKSKVLHHTVRDVAGTWGDPEIIASDASQGLNPNLPSLHVDNAGTLHAGWIARPPGSDETDKLFYSTKDPSSAWTLPVVINPVGNASHAGLAVFADGEAIGTWATTDVEISTLHPDGTWLPAVTVAQGSWPVVAPEDPNTIHLFFNFGAQLFYTKSQ